VPLVLTLKPKERIILAGAVIQNGSHQSRFTILNKVPVLREADILKEKEVVTPCQRLYYLIQSIYIDPEGFEELYKTYLQMVEDLTKAAPSMAIKLGLISERIANNDIYRALKLAQDLIEYESNLLRNHGKAST